MAAIPAPASVSSLSEAKSHPSTIRVRFPAAPSGPLDEQPVQTLRAGFEAAPTEPDPARLERSEEAAQALREIMAGDQLRLTASYLFVQKLVEVDLSQPFAEPSAMDLVRARLQELGDVREALERIHDASADPRIQPLLSPDRPLAAFMKGIYVWCDALLAAFEEVAIAAQSECVHVDWFALSAAVAEAQHYYFDGLVDAVRDEARALSAPPGGASALAHFEEDLEDLCWSTWWLNRSLALAFGGSHARGPVRR